jgi:hypothetical protein
VLLDSGIASGHDGNTCDCASSTVPQEGSRVASSRASAVCTAMGRLLNSADVVSAPDRDRDAGQFARIRAAWR